MSIHCGHLQALSCHLLFHKQNKPSTLGLVALLFCLAFMTAADNTHAQTESLTPDRTLRLIVESAYQQAEGEAYSRDTVFSVRAWPQGEILVEVLRDETPIFSSPYPSFPRVSLSGIAKEGELFKLLKEIDVIYDSSTPVAGQPDFSGVWYNVQFQDRRAGWLWAQPTQPSRQFARLIRAKLSTPTAASTVRKINNSRGVDGSKSTTLTISPFGVFVVIVLLILLVRHFAKHTNGAATRVSGGGFGGGSSASYSTSATPDNPPSIIDSFHSRDQFFTNTDHIPIGESPTEGIQRKFGKEARIDKEGNIYRDDRIFREDLGKIDSKGRIIDKREFFSEDRGHVDERGRVHDW